MERIMLKIIGVTLNIAGMIILTKPDGWLRSSDKLITKWKLAPLKILGLILSIIGTIILALNL